MRTKLTNVVLLVIGLAVVINGCSTTSDVVEESPPQETAKQETSVQPMPEPMAALENTFYFDFDDATVKPGARSVIQAHAERLKTNSQNIRIEGYADERGTEAYNRELGKRRADAVRELLVSYGVLSSQIETVSYGESNPLAMGSGEEIWQKNRRVVLK